MDDRICYIIGASGPADVYIGKQPSYIMACDKGIELLGGRKPDIAVGDFDSLGYVPEGVEVLFHPPEKDDTDVMLAVRRGLEMGMRTFVLYGCMGGRIDHAYANYQVLGFISAHGGHGYLVGDGWVTAWIKDEAITLHGHPGGVFSVFAPAGTAGGVTIRNAKYPLERYDITPEFPIGVSNEFISGSAKISVEHGSLLVMWHESPESLIERI